MSIVRAVADHRSASLQDALLLMAAMLGATILAIEYDLMRFGNSLAPEERRIRLEELFALSALLFSIIPVIQIACAASRPLSKLPLSVYLPRR
jgi:hypothetical protein